MTRKLTISIIGAILAHIAAGIGIVCFPWSDGHHQIIVSDPESSSPVEFMTVPEKAELLLTPAEITTPPVNESEPNLEPPALLPPPSAVELDPTPPRKEAEAQQQNKSARTQKIQEEDDRLRIARMKAADKALADARRQSTALEEERHRSDLVTASPVAPTKPSKSSARKPDQSSSTLRTTPSPSGKIGETRGPVTLRQSKPRYPRSLERRGIGGKVSVLIRIDVNGRVTSASVNRSSGHEQLDRAAIAAVNRWRFKPALKNGTNVASRTAVDIVFQPK